MGTAGWLSLTAPRVPSKSNNWSHRSNIELSLGQNILTEARSLWIEAGRHWTCNRFRPTGGQPVSANNFRDDINLTGVVDRPDLQSVQTNGVTRLRNSRTAEFDPVSAAAFLGESALLTVNDQLRRRFAR
jgi:hypothetical protein